MAEQDAVDITWNFSLSRPNALLRQTIWLGRVDACTFSDSLSSVREIELIFDKKLSIDKYPYPFLSQSAMIPEGQFIKMIDLAQKAVSAYTDLLGDATVLIGDTYLSSQIKGRSLFSILRYNPSRLKNESLLQFIFYQIICLLESLHKQGIPHLNLETNNVFLDESLRLNIAPPCIKRMEEYAENSVDQTSPQNIISDIQYSDEFQSILSGWIHKKVSNFDYLMYINRLAGRRAGDPTASAVLPWVTDFSSPLKGTHLRDLTRTKFRLTKGEHQMDATYFHFEQSKVSNPVGEAGKNERFLPHHLLDMMPNLAYYTYKARQTPVETLQRYVRPVYRPGEFPTSLQRLYATTPEECIPEFFVDSSIFTSIHPNMPDLQLPEWFSGSTTDFLRYHRDVLESDAVSANLHHWIDLTFGYRLLGKAAVSAKNVHLELVSPDPPSNSCVTCLFSLPHPRRAVFGDDLIEAYEEASDFFMKMCASLPPEFERPQQENSQQPTIDTLLKIDLEDLASLIVEVAVGSTIPGVVPQLQDVNRSTRLRRARHLLITHETAIPNGFSKPLKLILFDSTWGNMPLGLIRRCFFDVPLHIIDLYRVHTGLHPCATARLDQLHLKDGPFPGPLLNAFLALGSPPQRFDCPASTLNLLTLALERAIETDHACAVNALVSGRLVQFYLAVGGKMAVQKYLLPLVQHCLTPDSRLCSRRFLRHLLLSTYLPAFLSIVPTLLANSLLRCSSEASSSPSVIGDCECSATVDINDVFCRAFLHTSVLREDVSVPLVAAVQGSLRWLATGLGPLATAKYLVPPLLAALTRCYWGEENLLAVMVEQRTTRLNYCIPKSPLPMPVYTSGRVLRGDIRAPGVLRCLEQLACIYGVEVVIGLYLPAVKVSVSIGLSTLRSVHGSSRATSAPLWDVDCEARLISSLVFLHQIVTYLSAPHLMDNLQIIITCLADTLTLSGRSDVNFPHGSLGRLALLCKSLDCIYILGVRLGFEIVRSQMTELIQLLFSLFDRSVNAAQKSDPSAVDEEKDGKSVRFFANCDSDEESRDPESQQQEAAFFVIKLDRHTSSLTVAKEEQGDDTSQLPQCPPSPTLSFDADPIPVTPPPDRSTSGWKISAILSELHATFTPELAYVAYFSLCRLAGGSHVDSALYNIDFIHGLVRQHEADVKTSGNGITKPNGRQHMAINTDYEAKLAASSSVSNPSSTHLQGEWVEYFRTKIESPSSIFSPSSIRKPQPPLKFLGKRLFSFAGHSSAVRSITSLANESSIITTSNDRSVHLYSLTSARESAATASVASASVGSRGSSRRTISESSDTSYRPSSLPPPLTSVSVTTTQQALITPNLAFTGHRRAVFASAYLHFERLVASLDTSLLLLWDPFTGQKVSSFAPSDTPPDNNGSGACVLRSSSTLPAYLSALSSGPAYRSTLLAGDETGCLLLIDPRVGNSTSVVLRLFAAVPIADATATGISAAPSTTTIAAENSPLFPFGRSEAPARSCSLNNITDKCVLSVSGALRCLAPMLEDNNSVFCGFSSGLVSNVDIRTGGVVATWRAHSDAVSQIFCHSSGWFSTVSDDQSIAFWQLDEGTAFPPCHRVAQHLNSMGGGSGSSGITCCTSQLLPDSLFIAGPVSPSSVIVSDSISLLPTAPTTCVLGCYDNVPLATSTSVMADAAFRPMGTVVLRGKQLSAMASLPLTDAILTGTTSGQLSLYY